MPGSELLGSISRGSFLDHCCCNLGVSLSYIDAITVPEIKNGVADWNFYIDPHAANIVLRSGVPGTLVPLDATNAVPLNTAVAAKLGTSPSAAFVRSLITSLLPAGAPDSARFFFWDPLHNVHAEAGWSEFQLPSGSSDDAPVPVS